ncbi:MAG: prolipoprotein diacylglyceryl transferase [Lachnospiraceae bacterium]|nr:prolipoprotein diacylglyceryl transferase [Lachnospiraceae bacterium]
MYNELLKIGPVTLHGYGLMIGIGIFVCFSMADRRAKKLGLDPDVIFNVGFISVIFGFISSKLFFLMLSLPDIIRNGGFWKALSGNGFIVYGGLTGGVITAIIYLRIKKIPFLPYFDLAAPSMVVAQAIGRLGCFLAGCCYGRETDSRFGIMFQNSSSAPNGVNLIPTQLISSFGDFVIMFVLLWYAKKKPKAGRVGALYIILYAVGRFFVEMLRNDYRGALGVLSTSQLISILMLIPGIWLFVGAKSKE